MSPGFQQMTIRARLRVVNRNGSIGATLVIEGLARPLGGAPPALVLACFKKVPYDQPRTGTDILQAEA